MLFTVITIAIVLLVLSNLYSYGRGCDNGFDDGYNRGKDAAARALARGLAHSVEDQDE